MEYTNYYNLKKPNKGDNYNINDVTCDNADILDEKLYSKQGKVPGKGLSTNDFTNAYKNKLDGLKNYDDTDIKNSISTINKKIEQIDSKNEEQDSAIEENANKLERLKNNQIEDTTELATTIEIQDSANVEAKINIQGNTEQKQLSGKNKVRGSTNKGAL